MIRKIFKWVFKLELQKLELQIQKSISATATFEDTKRVIDNVLENVDVSVDVHEYNRHANSWAVISIQGHRSDYIKFIDLGKSDIHEIEKFLRSYERISNVKIDASPQASKFLWLNRK